jgi:hypothetical protein
MEDQALMWCGKYVMAACVVAVTVTVTACVVTVSMCRGERYWAVALQWQLVYKAAWTVPGCDPGWSCQHSACKMHLQLIWEG